MSSSAAFLCILLLCLVALDDAFIRVMKFRRRPKCSSKRNCVSCTKTKTWIGKPCRWCPVDGNCHTFGAVFTNPCSRSQNVKDAKSCSRIVHVKYDRNVAYKMVYLSALAYANSSSSYISKAKEVKTFRVIRQVTRACEGGAECSGFVAVSHTEKVVAVAFRGSEKTTQVLIQAVKILTTPKVRFQAGGKVQKYFRDVFRLLWNQLKDNVYEQIARYPSYKVWVTGHSLGGAVASLASTVIRHDRKTSSSKLYLYTFGQPRVGNYNYALKHDTLVPTSFRVVHFRDPVVHLPTCFSVPGTPCISFTGGPYHHGREIFYPKRGMSKSSSYKTCNGLPHNEDLKCSNNIKVWKNCFTTKGLKNCIKDHTSYFGIDVGNWWTTL